MRGNDATRRSGGLLFREGSSKPFGLSLKKPPDLLFRERLAPGLPKAPSHLSRAAQEEWERMAPAVHRAGLLRDGDQVEFANFCQGSASVPESRRPATDHAAEIFRRFRDHKHGARR